LILSKSKKENQGRKADVSKRKWPRSMKSSGSSKTRKGIRKDASNVGLDSIFWENARTAKGPSVSNAELTTTATNNAQKLSTP
jgi:hypothetical protein